MLKPRESAKEKDGEKIESLQEIQLATLNILEDFNAEKSRLEDTQRAVLNILDDFNSEKNHLESTQKATINILEDFNAEKSRLEDTQRAVLNILDDFNSEKNHLEGTQKATLNILEDFNAEKSRLEDTQRAVLNILDDFDIEKTKVEQANLLLQTKSEELQEARDALEIRVIERTAALEASLREKEALLKEIHHRVKNNLQIIHSMLNLQLPQVRDRQSIELFKESQNRVYTMALIHEKLYQSESMALIDLPEYIRSLITNLFLSYGVTGNVIKPKIDVEDVSFDIDTAIPCALIINELVSNSLKHAFPDSRSPDSPGEVCVVLRHDGSGNLVLRISDTGIGLPPGFEIQKCHSLGLKLVSALTRQIGGAINISTGGGTAFAILFPDRSGEGVLAL